MLLAPSCTYVVTKKVHQRVVTLTGGKKVSVSAIELQETTGDELVT